MSLVREGNSTLANLYETQGQSDLLEILPSVVMPILDESAITTAEWYDSLVPTSRYRVSDDQNAVSEGRINYTAAWSFKPSGIELPVDRMIGAFQRMVFDASRAVVIDNAKAEGARWHRDALAEACSFCRLLTVDPHAYNGKYVDMPSHNHDCRCLAVVSRPGNAYVPPDYVDNWRAEVEQSRSGGLTSTLAAMDHSNV